MSLIEVVLSSTRASSPLPLTSVHSLETGQLLYSFKSPPPPSTTTTTTNNNGNGKGKQVETTSEGRQTMSFVPGGGGHQGIGSCLIGLAGKDGRAILNVWNFTRESTVARLIPPVRLTTVSTSPDGQYLSGGTVDGRIFLWEFSTGTLLSTLDAHYRAITSLEWTQDASCLISASEDAGCSVWSIGRILNSTPMNPATPFTTLSDHTLGITSIKAGLGIFPNSRIFTSSKDGTVKVWDLSTSPASLLTTLQFPGPVQHLVVDPLERFLFVSIPTTTTTATSANEGDVKVTNGSKVIRVNLYRESTDKRAAAGGGGGIVSVGGTGSIGELERIDTSTLESEPGMTYTLSEPISALHLSNHSPTLLISTEQSSQIHVLSLASLLPTRIISPPPASTPYGGLDFLTSFLYQKPSATSTQSGGSGGEGVQRELPNSLGRSVVGIEERERGGKGGKSVWLRVQEQQGEVGLGRGGGGGGGRNKVVEVEDLIQPVRGLNPCSSSLLLENGTLGGGGGGSSVVPSSGGGGDQRELIEKLERELEGYKKGLEKARGVNERIWKSVVEGTLSPSTTAR